MRIRPSQVLCQKLRAAVMVLCCVLMCGFSLRAQDDDKTLLFKVTFPVNEYEINETFGNNDNELSLLREFLYHLIIDPSLKVEKITYVGSASPEGAQWRNEMLSQRRVNALKNEIIRMYNEANLAANDTYSLGANHIEFESLVETSAVNPELALTSLRYATVEFTLNRPIDAPAEDYVVPQKPRPYIEFPDTIPTTGVYIEDFNPYPTEAEPKPDTDPKKYPTKPIKPHPGVEFKDQCLGGHYLKTNMIGWGMEIANLALEFQFSRHWSLTLPVYFSGVNYIKSNIKFRTLTFQPELRYWWHNYNGTRGWWLGFHPGVGYFNFALGGDYRYQDHNGTSPAVGGGISVGYRTNLTHNGRLAIEFSVGAGAYKARYDKFDNRIGEAGRLVEGDIHKTFIGVDQVSITLAWRFYSKKPKDPKRNEWYNKYRRLNGVKDHGKDGTFPIY